MAVMRMNLKDFNYQIIVNRNASDAEISVLKNVAIGAGMSNVVVEKTGGTTDLGADGVPEVVLLLKYAGAVLAGGILAAIGTDVWEGCKKFISIIFKKYKESNLENQWIYNPIIVVDIHINDKSKIQIHFPRHSEEELEKSLKALQEIFAIYNGEDFIVFKFSDGKWTKTKEIFKSQEEIRDEILNKQSSDVALNSKKPIESCPKLIKTILRILFLFFPLLLAFVLIRSSEGVVSISVKEACFPTDSNLALSLCSSFSEKIQIASAEVAKNTSKFSGLIPILNSALFYKISIVNNLSSNLQANFDNPERSEIMNPVLSCDYNTNKYEIAPNNTMELIPSFDPFHDILPEIKCLVGFNYLLTKQLTLAPNTNISVVYSDGNFPETRGEFKFTYKFTKLSKSFIYIGILLFWFGIIALMRNAVLFYRKGFKFFTE
jgi:hypothetical protein